MVYNPQGPQSSSAEDAPNDTTRWNSIYDMLKFAVKHYEAIDSITGNLKMKLKQFELSEDDWTIATKL